MRTVLLAATLAVLAAPLQCERSPDPELRREETPDEALRGLADRFAAAGDEAARRETLEYLVERYPSSRFAPYAREELARDRGGAAGAGAAP